MSLVSNMLFVFFSIRIFSYRRKPKLGLEMKWHYLVVFVISEALAYYYICDAYEPPDNEYIVSGFFASNVLLFWRGILPMQFLQLISFNLIHFEDEPTIIPLLFALVFDYLFFLLLSYVRRSFKIWKKNKPKKRKFAE